jgi:N-hydroxyarylamine O-acetyltransferase
MTPAPNPIPPDAAPEHAVDLDAYCARIGFLGPREASLPTLRALHHAHATSIPFENLDVLAGRRISLSLGDLERKLVRDRRGGYCFEHGTLMMHALREMGFDVAPVIARIRWQIPEDVVTNLGHMRLLVRLGGRSYIADAGLGSTTLTEPLVLEHYAEQATSLDLRRLIPTGDGLLEQVSFGAGWADICVFNPVMAPLPDFELGNWYYCTHPDSTFIRNLVIARPGEDRRYSILNHEFVIRHLDGRAQRETIRSPERLRTVLKEYFDLEWPDVAALACEGLRWDA